IGVTPIFIPIPGLWIFFGGTVLLSLLTFISVRKRREPVDSPDRIRWSGMKMLLYALIVVSFGWLSSDVVGIIRGVRHPWMTAIPQYYLLAGIATAFGTWLCTRLLPRLPLTKCPYIFYKRTAIMLTLYMILFGI